MNERPFIGLTHVSIYLYICARLCVSVRRAQEGKNKSCSIAQCAFVCAKNEVQELRYYVSSLSLGSLCVYAVSPSLVKPEGRIKKGAQQL